MKELNRSVIGTTTGPQTFEYTWRDCAIYALGVGAGPDEMEYLDEDGLKVIPSFGVVPYWGTFGINPPRAIPTPINCTMGLDRQGSLHMAHKLVLHKPIDPMGGKLTFEDSVVELYDRGPGKGCVMRTDLSAYDEKGEKVFSNIGDTLFAVYQAPDSPPFPKSSTVIPERAPDYVCPDYIAPNQNLLYRMSGDTNRLHVDQKEAHKQGFDRPIMQGLCSFGYACRMAVRELIPHAPERMTSMEAQFRSPLFPDTKVELHIWKGQDGLAYFRMLAPEKKQIVLEKGCFMWK